MRKYKAIVERNVIIEVTFWARDDNDAAHKCVGKYIEAVQYGTEDNDEARLIGMDQAYLSNLEQQ